MAEAIHHGGRLAEARRRYPGAPEPWIDLSTGINPHPYPFAPPPASAFARLPEPEEEQALREAAARAYGVADPAMVVAAPGTQILISLLPRLRPLARVAVVGPTYAEHAACWAASGSIVREVPTLSAAMVREGGLFAPSSDAAEALDGRLSPSIAAALGVVLCNPNNPDGRIHPSHELLPIAARLADLGGLLVVDEAFADLDGKAASVAPFLPRDGLLVFRSFGKPYGLAGLRLGFALAAPSLATQLRGALGPWAVSGPAIAIAAQAFADRTWLAATSARLAQHADRLDALLTQAGLRVVGGTPLFRLAEADGAPAVSARLGRAGILVRCFTERERWLRFGLPGKEEQWARLERALGIRA